MNDKDPFESELLETKPDSLSIMTWLVTAITLGIVLAYVLTH